ncbi:MAG: HEAT repeat domain-containing protein [Planctomycetota bacterium]|jgi:hypothetical protein
MLHPSLRTGLILALAALLGGALGPASALAATAKDEKESKKGFMAAYQAAGDDEAARAKTLEMLESAPDSVKVDMLIGKVLPRDDAPPVQTRAVRVLKTVKEAGALKKLIAAAQKKKGKWAVRGTALEALGSMESDLAVQALVKVVKKGDTMGMAGALYALAERCPPEARDDVYKLMDHSAWQVRLGTLEYLGGLKDKSTLPWLVDRLEEESGRLRHEVVVALQRATGKRYGDDALKWRALAAGDDPEKVEKETPTEKKVTKGATGSAVTEEIKPTYYGEPVYSGKVVFVVDLSLSMNAEMVIDRDMLVRETGAVVTGDAEKTKEFKKKHGEVMPIEWWKIRTRKDFAVAQLKFVISTLKRDQAFDVVWYSDSIKAWQGGLVPARPQIKLKAAAWMDGLECEGGTNTWGGIAKALNLVGRGTDKENYTRGADTIYFLSDGQPSVGDIVDTDKIVAALERIYKVRRVNINVIQIGTSPLPFMERIARVTEGKFKFFKAGPKKN